MCDLHSVVKGFFSSSLVSFGVAVLIGKALIQPLLLASLLIFISSPLSDAALTRLPLTYGEPLSLVLLRLRTRFAHAMVDPQVMTRPYDFILR